MTSMDSWPLGVFASVDAGLGVQWDVVREFGVTTVHLHAPSQQMRTGDKSVELQKKLRDLGIEVTVVFGGFEGESYADIPTTQRTVGLVPLATRAARLAEMCEISDFAKRMGVPRVGLHIGFIPHKQTDAESQQFYQDVVVATQKLCAHCQANAQALHLETGQETADGLLQFLADVNRPNLFVNFDPANMILYGTGEPLEALRKVGKYVRSVHCKDALWAANPGKEWGQEVPLGKGNVGMENFLRTLLEIGYQGPLTIEREIPQEPQRQRDEIGHAVNLLRDLKKKLLPAS
jgi:sugar phosphate isomerase/epimerase